MIKHIYYRIFQKIIHAASYFLSFKEPTLLINKGNDVTANILIKEHIKRVMIVTDLGLSKTIPFQGMLEVLSRKNIYYIIYDKTIPNPDVTQVDESFEIYQKEHLEGIIAFGGGSPMDLAKALGVRVVKPKKSIDKFKGIIKVRKKLPVLIAIPTTVGTGSEATVAAVISNRKTNEKYAIMDPVLIPKYAILDVSNVESLPPKLVATTGMDALTHAIEAYIGKSNTKKTKKYALNASKLIFNHIEKAYEKDKDALAKMQRASYEAGVAFTRAYVGNVHALAHTFGGFYQVPHGYANAIILPHVLRYYGKRVHKKLSEIAIYSGIATNQKTRKENAIKLIETIDNLNQKMGLPKYIENAIKKSDIDEMVLHAYCEANPLYPVPMLFKKQDFYHMYRIITNEEV